MRGATKLQDNRAFYEEVGRRIRDARRKRHPLLTQDGLAKLVGLTRTSITNLEKGRQKCLLHSLVEIAVALQVNPSTLIPYPTDQIRELDRALKNRAPAEKNWIKAAVTAASNAKEAHGA